MKITHESLLQNRTLDCTENAKRDLQKPAEIVSKRKGDFRPLDLMINNLEWRDAITRGFTLFHGGCGQNVH